MTDQERDATLSIAFMAARADGAQDDREEAALRRIAASLDPAGGGRLAALAQELQAGRLTPEAAAAALGSPEARRHAFEVAVAVCDADGVHGEAEGRFLERLRVALGLGPAEAQAITGAAGAIAAAPLGGPAPEGRAAPDAAALDQQILEAAILNGALELLPHSLATMAIVPLQMRLVYRIGQAYGYQLDAGHLKDFLATAGVGLASQYVEQLGRRLVGGLAGGLLGGLLGGLASAATGSALAFASTWALGRVAQRYYGGGRQLTAEALREVFQAMLAEGRGLQARYAGAVRERAATVDVTSLASLVR